MEVSTFTNTMSEVMVTPPAVPLAKWAKSMPSMGVASTEAAAPEPMLFTALTSISWPIPLVRPVMV